MSGYSWIKRIILGKGVSQLFDGDITESKITYRMKKQQIICTTYYEDGVWVYRYELWPEDVITHQAKQ